MANVAYTLRHHVCWGQSYIHKYIYQKGHMHPNVQFYLLSMIEMNYTLKNIFVTSFLPTGFNWLKAAYLAQRSNLLFTTIWINTLLRNTHYYIKTSLKETTWIDKTSNLVIIYSTVKISCLYWKDHTICKRN